MICVSTRGQAPAVSFSQAVLEGLAPDGGLYVPSTLSPIAASTWSDWRGATFQGVATVLARVLLGDEIAPEPLAALVADALNFPIPVVRLSDDLWVVELFHGPTFAFKDVGARVLARLMSHLQAHDAAPLTVLVATSGDTGSAVAQAFFGVPRTRVVVLYPEGQVSAVQEAQFTTLGGNVTAVAVQGTFDDCQRLAKLAFADAALRERVRLTSANSISLGRLVPQLFYHAYAALQAPADAPAVIAVPSGNFGNLAAGVLAWRLGAPIAGFIAATNVNDTVPRYLESGRVEPRPSVATLANAMDVGNPSNLERLRWLFHDNVESLRALVAASVHTDAEVRAAIAELDQRYGYIADPHTAIGYLGATRSTAPGHLRTPAPPRLAPSHRRATRMFLATAHPAKFREVVEPVIGRPVPLPPALAAALACPRLVERIPPTLGALAGLL